MNTLNSYRIIYAENNEDTYEPVTFLCQLADIKVVTAQTTREAWQSAQAE